MTMVYQNSFHSPMSPTPTVQYQVVGSASTQDGMMFPTLAAAAAAYQGPGAVLGAPTPAPAPASVIQNSQPGAGPASPVAQQAIIATANPALASGTNSHCGQQAHVGMSKLQMHIHAVQSNIDSIVLIMKRESGSAVFADHHRKNTIHQLVDIDTNVEQITVELNMNPAQLEQGSSNLSLLVVAFNKVNETLLKMKEKRPFSQYCYFLGMCQLLTCCFCRGQCCFYHGDRKIEKLCEEILQKTSGVKAKFAKLDVNVDGTVKLNAKVGGTIRMNTAGQTDIARVQ